MTMAWVPHEIRNLMSYDDPSSLTSPQAADDLDNQGTSPARSHAHDIAEDTSTDAPHTPEQSRRKRLSLFSRSNSDASRRPAPADISEILHATMIHGKGHDADPLNHLASSHYSRPSTAQSTDSRRRPNEAFESLRNSIFRGRKRSAGDGKHGKPRSSSRLSQHSSKNSYSIDTSKADISKANTGLIPFSESATKTEEQKPKEGTVFKSEEEYYQHRKKSSISPPFNFQHVTHTAKKHLPKLETVDEKDLKTKFWAVNAYQKPKEQLHGIKVEDLEKRRDRSLSPGARAELPKRSSQSGSTLTPTHTVTRSLDETLFDETQETKFDPDAALQSLHEVNQADSGLARRHPKHYSSMSSLASVSTTSTSKPQHLRVHASFDSGSPNRTAPESSAHHKVRASLPNNPAPGPGSAPGKAPINLQRKPVGQSVKANQSLPPIPAQKEQPQQDSQAPAKTYSLFPAPPSKKVETPPSTTSKRSSKSAGRTSRSSLSSSTKRTEVLSEASWEDDIDFAYEHGAEAMLEDWETGSPLQEIDENEPLPPPRSHPSPDGSIESGVGGVRLSLGMDPPAAITSDSSSAVYVARSNTETPEQQHKRGSSVGHKGFAAARTASQEAVSKSPSVALEGTPQRHQNTPPPKFSVTDSDLNLQSPNSSTMQLATVDHDVSGYLSDPESTRTGGSRHRKSSSYGSYESSGRSLHIGSDATRWSSCSTSSMPDLLHSKRKSRSSVCKKRMSRPLESVPHSPDFERGDKQDESSLTVPPNRLSYGHTERAVTDSVIMRRPPTGDRQALYSAGRTVQRGRSATPSRVMRASSGTPPAEEIEGGWI